MMLTKASINANLSQRLKVWELTGSQVVVDMRFSSVPEKEIVW